MALSMTNFLEWMQSVPLDQWLAVCLIVSVAALLVGMVSR